MKSFLSTLLLLMALCLSITSKAQDTILTVTGQKIPSKIILVTNKVILYYDADGQKQVMDRDEIKFTTINSTPDYFTVSIEQMPKHPENYKNIAGIYLQKSAKNKSSAIILSVLGGVTAGAGLLLSDSKGGRAVFGGIGGVMGILSFGLNISSIANQRKAGELLEKAP